MKLVKLQNLVAIFLTVLSCLSIGPAAQARTCTKGKACGNSCISKNDVCHKGAPPATAVTASTSVLSNITAKTLEPVESQVASRQITAPRKIKNCSKGKICGNTCISATAVCKNK